jgi:hypothetical protein
MRYVPLHNTKVLRPMDIGTLMAIEFFAFFGGGLAFAFWQLYVLKRDERVRRAKEDAARQRGEIIPDPPKIPGWMARR